MSAPLKVSPTSWVHSLGTNKPAETASRNSYKITADNKRGDNQYTIAANIGDGTDAINFILVAADCPAKFRPFIDAIVGLAGDRTEWFEADDLQVGMRARVGDEKFSRVAAQKWVQRWRKEFCEWQTRKNLALVECSPGGKDTNGINYRSRYKVNLLRLAADTVKDARDSTQWNRDPSSALELAAQAILEETPETPSYKQRFRSPRTDDEAMLKRSKKTVMTLFNKMIDIERRRGGEVEELLEVRIRAQQAFARVDSFVHPEVVHTLEEEEWTTESQGGGGAVDSWVDNFVHPEAEEADIDPITEAYEALDAFSTAGATDFIVTMKDESTGAVTADNVTLRELVAKFPNYIERNSHERESLIVRPTNAVLIQVDDCTLTECNALASVAFLIAETSTDNYQAWLALPDGTSGDERKRVRDRLLRGAWKTSANVGAGGAMRFPGSLNCKPERRRADGSLPRVRLVNSSSGRFTTEAELESAGLLAPPCDSSLPLCCEPLPKRGGAAEPSYAQCERSVKRKTDGKIDRSGVDALFAVTCFDWKLGFNRVVELLKSKSPKAKSRNDDYAERTATWAYIRAQARA
jgi:hypothetical protein